MGVKAEIDKGRCAEYSRPIFNVLRLKDGDNWWRIVTGPVRTRSHWFPTLAMDDTGAMSAAMRRIDCSTTPNCILCRLAGAETAAIPGEGRSTLSASTKYLFVVIDRDEQEQTKEVALHIGEIPYQAFQDLNKFQNNPDYGDMNQYDIMINRGKDPKTGRYTYSIQPARENTPFTEDEEKAMEECELDIDEVAKPPTDEAVRDFLTTNKLNLLSVEKIKVPQALAQALKVMEIEYFGEEARQLAQDAGKEAASVEGKGTESKKPSFGTERSGRAAPPPEEKKPAPASRGKEEPKGRGTRGAPEKPTGRGGKKAPF